MSFTLGAKRPEDFGLIIAPGTLEPAIPEIRNKTLEIPGRPGLYGLPTELGTRTFELKCVMNEQHRTALQNTIRLLAAHLVDQYGQPKVLDLFFDMEPDKVYQVRCTSPVTVEQSQGIGSLTLPLTAYDPFAYLNEYTADITVDSEVSVDNDISLDAIYSYQSTSAQTISIDNFGSQAAQPIIEVTGSFTTLTLRIDEQEFSYNTPLSGETLIIDSANFTAKIGTSNVLGDISGDFLSLPVGVIPVKVDGTDLNCSVTFRFKPKFI